MQNRAIEIHDSVLARISSLDGYAILDFSSVYIHQSSGTPLRDAGSGWVQKAQLRIKDGVIEGSFSERLADLQAGHLALGGTILENEIPIPLNFNGDIELRLESWGEVVFIKGQGAELELIGEPEYVEEFRPNSD
jgi:hypothetical protein